MGHLKQSADNVQSVFAGLLGLVCPIPGIHGASLEKVQYVFLANGINPAITKDVPRAGRLLLSELRKGVQWSQRNTAYQEKVGAEVREGLALREGTAGLLKVEPVLN